jgi:serine/threonine protein kinase
MNAAVDSRERAQPFGKYMLVERLGRGGMAEVWKAKMSGPAGFSRTLVVKRILPHLVEDPHFVQMFVSEARLSARLNHGNIVQVYELGDVDGEYYLAMEYVRGRDLVNVVRAQLLKGQAPPPGLGAIVGREVCRALAYAHGLTDERGTPLRLIHRDVSPSNVMISFDGAVKLLDFGIAKALGEASESKTVTGTLKGKFGYMSPEQIDGREIDHRADLFAVGVVLHEVLTGRRLFKGATDLATIALVRETKVEPPSLLNPAVPKELDEICLKALARDPDARYKGCDEMAIALDDVAHTLKWGPERLTLMLRELFPDEPSHSRELLPPTEAGASQEVAARRRGRWLALGIVGLALASGLGVWLLASRANRAANVVPPVVTGAVADKSPPPAAPVARPSASVTVRVVTTPPGADVLVGNELGPRGQAPLALTLARGDQVTHVTVRLKGYDEQTTEVTPDSDSRLQLTLSRSAPPRSAASHGGKGGKVKTATAPAAATTQKLPDLHNGDVVDPFAR